MSKINCLITGSSGFVGQNIIKNLGNDALLFKKLSLRDEQWQEHLSNNKYDAYIHLAGIAHDLANVNNEDIYYEVNYELTKKIYKRFLEDAQAKTFIFFSSIKALEDHPKEILTEEMKANPKTVYGKSKRLAENYILDNIPSNKRVIILRPCMIHGPDNKGNLNTLVKAIQLNIPWVFGAFENKRSYCNIDNLCFVVNKLLQTSTLDSGVYHLSDDTSLSTNELVKLIADELDKKVLILKIPKSMLRVFAKLGNLLHLPFNSSTLNKVVGTYEVSNHKLKKGLNLASLPISSREGLISTISQYKDE